MPHPNSPNAPLFVIEALNGRTYHGPTLEDALQDMRDSAWACTERTLSGYMKGVARRVRDWDGTRIRTDSVDHFVADMVQAGQLVIRSTH
jgi:hypothetical protein